MAYLCFARPEDIPQVSVSWLGLPADKVGHFVMFIPFPILGHMVFGNRDMKLGGQFALLALLMGVGTGLAAGTEQIQALLAYRTADQSDLLADIGGMMLGGLITTITILTRKDK